MPKAYSYIRFSTKIQSKGDSLRRQQIIAEEYINDNPELDLILDTELNMLDIGMSAFKSKNVTEGKLGKFIEAIDLGKVKAGSYLLLENFDRFSRDQVDTAVELLIGITKKGIVVVTLEDKRIYKSPLKMHDLMISVGIMERANEESVRKSNLIRKAKNARKIAIINGDTDLKLGKQSPAWLTLSEDRKSFKVDEDRANIVHQLFQWSVEGYGIRKSIQRLEEMNIKPFVHHDIKVGRIPKRWNNGIISRWFKDRRVLGEYTLKITDKNGQSKHNVIKDYFPRIVDDELFYRAEKARISRGVRAGGRKGITLTNLFAKLAVCGYSTDTRNGNAHRCAGNHEYMIYSNKDRHLRYLICSRKITGNTGCEACSKYWRYENFEISFLTHIRDIDVSTLIGQPSQLKLEIESISKSIAAKEGELCSIKNGHEELIEEVSGKARLMKMFESKLLEMEDQQILLVEEIKQLTTEVKSKQYEYDQGDDKKALLSEYIDKMQLVNGQELYDLRLKLSELLKSVIDRVEVYSKGSVTTLDDLRRLLKTEEEAQLAYKYTNMAEEDVPFNPFFNVYYKSGGYSMVIPDLKHPENIFMHSKVESDNSFKILGETFEGDFKSLDTLRDKWNNA